MNASKEKGKKNPLPSFGAVKSHTGLSRERASVHLTSSSDAQTSPRWAKAASDDQQANAELVKLKGFALQHHYD